jgi:hypothetical protein
LRRDRLGGVVHEYSLVTRVFAPYTLFGIARMYTAIAEGSKYKASVFRNLEDANRWLDAACAATPG